MGQIKGKVLLLRVAGIEMVSQRELSIEISDEMLDKTHKRDAAKKRVPQGEYDISESVGGLYESDVKFTEDVTADSATKVVTFDSAVQRLYPGQTFQDASGTIGNVDEKYTIASVTLNDDNQTTSVTVEESISDVTTLTSMETIVYKGVNDLITSIQNGTEAELYIISDETGAPTYSFDGYVNNISVEANKDDLVTYSTDFVSNSTLTTGTVS